MIAPPPILPGTRLAVFGRSGSGKTYLEKWQMLRTRYHWVVLDTKSDSGFDEWLPQKGLIPMSRVSRLWKDRQIVVVRPKPHELADPKFLDMYLGELHDAYEGFGICIDETYQVALGHRAGAGLTGVVTRGRDRRQSVIIGSQRPAWVPQFCFSEANAYCVLSLTMDVDRKKVFANTGRGEFLHPQAPRSWVYYDVAENRLTRYKPVTIT